MNPDRFVNAFFSINRVPTPAGSGVVVLLCAILLGVPVGPAYGQDPVTRPSARHQTVAPLDDVPRTDLPSVGAAETNRATARAPNRVNPYRYGTVIDTRITPATHGVWEQLPSGDWLWRLRVHSENAVSLSLGFHRFVLPRGSGLFVHDAENGTTRGPYTRDDATDGAHWTPFVRGSEAVIELVVPSGRRPDVHLVLGRVVHGFRSLQPTGTERATAKAGACNVDVACDEANPWSKQVRSVGLFSYVQNGTAYVCSGALVNNTAQDKTPYFLTAEHCATTPEVASTMVFYWNYQNPTCRTRGSSENGTVTDDPPDDQTSTGAILRARYGDFHRDGTISGGHDLALVEVDDDIPERYQLYFSGWSRVGNGATQGVTIHHPAGDGKRISFDDDPLTITGFGDSNGGTTHLRVGDWDLGTTEGGSSGAPLFNAEQKIVGVLSGGFAGCESSTSPNDNDLPDWFGRVAPGFRNGDFENTTLADWLDPLDTGKDTLGGLPQAENVDLTSPAPVQNFHVDIVSTADLTVTLEWVATGDDNRRGAAEKYDLRFDTTRIETGADFRDAQRVRDVIAPAAAGEQERFDVDADDGLQQNQTYYFALVAIDDAGNRSGRATTKREVALVNDIEIGPGGVQAGVGNTSARTRFVLNRSQEVRVALYDLLGRRVRVVFDQRVPEGIQQMVQFDTGSLSSGPYFLRFTGETFTTSRKFVVVH